ncbi:fatty acyl-CoA reductase 1-like [Lycium ferocissimum]|uniref:fatty acyl-CoA reductase 1-like n=1 Tax=Lycium ferocissimum TaxID=112874 RepID=UPI002814ACF9|nr:fatty acyl-CoA reductase 1-like [Lycium ferocissimum]
MEASNIEPFLDGKTIFITGATGFLAKILVEKILRIQPNVKKLFLLVRAADTKSAQKRFTNEVMQTQLFSVLREKIGANNLNSLIKEKVFPVAGDISFEDFGIENSEMKDKMSKEIDIIINSAATTRFDERYDIAMNINVLGALNVLKFAKRCENVNIIAHVSTAYVCGEGEGVIPEKSFSLGETLNKDTKLDIDVERKVIEDKLKELEAQNLTIKEVTMAMRDLGIQRATMHGWPNTYSFTKAMGEMLLGHYKENLQLAIIRPTIITSTYKEPFPGWIEGVKTVDSFILAYGKGVLNFSFGDPNSYIDAIPGDMVVNAILAAIIAHTGNQYNSSQGLIYHISSSRRNPLKSSDIRLFLFNYFTKNPWINKDGNIIKVGMPTLFNSMDSFRKYISTYYWPLLKILELANLLSWRSFDKTYKDTKRKIDMAIRLAELYKPYLLFHGSFDDANTEGLRMAMKECNMDDVLNFDPSCIIWEDYFMKTHLPGAVKHIF